jgi:hypothetical protein
MNNIITHNEKPEIIICFVRKVSHLYLGYIVSVRSARLQSVWSYRILYTNFVLIITKNEQEEKIIIEVLVNEVNNCAFTTNSIGMYLFGPSIDKYRQIMANDKLNICNGALKSY